MAHRRNPVPTASISGSTVIGTAGEVKTLRLQAEMGRGVGNPRRRFGWLVRYAPATLTTMHALPACEIPCSFPHQQ